MSTTLPRPPLAPSTWPSWVALGIAAGLARVPRPLQTHLGRVIGSLALAAGGRRRRIAARNLELCFPALDQGARDALLRANFRSMGESLFEFSRAWWGNLGSLSATSPIYGLEHLSKPLTEGRGVILLSGHFLTLEVCGRLLCGHIPITGMYRPMRDRVFEWAILAGRRRYAEGMLLRSEVRAAVRLLRAGGVLWYAPDQDIRGKDTVFAPFFGIPAASITATHTFARLSGAAVIGFFHRRLPDRSGYELRIEPPLADFPSHDPIADTARVNGLIERMVREAPDEYLWAHRRFHRRPPGEPALYS